MHCFIAIPSIFVWGTLLSKINGLIVSVVASSELSSVIIINMSTKRIGMDALLWTRKIFSMNISVFEICCVSNNINIT